MARSRDIDCRRASNSVRLFSAELGSAIRSARPYGAHLHARAGICGSLFIPV